MHFPALIQDLAVILGVAAVITFVFRRIKQPVVLGYVVAGIVVGPHTPALFSVADTESIKVWAELGVIFLMFTLGLEFSFRRLAKVGISAGGTAIFQILAMMICGLVTANILGWTRLDAIFLGCMIAISSTTIIIKAFEELGLKSKKFAELVFGILIVEDLAAIVMLVALTNIATTSQVGGIDLLFAGGKLAIVVGAWFLVGMFLVPRFVKSVSRYGNDEMLTVVSISLCLALVAVAAYFHYSVALGAFIMGSILAESTEAKRIEHLVQPLKDIFGAVFFVSVGMLLDPKVIFDNLGAVALLSFVIISGKLLAVTVGAFATGQTIRSSIQTGFSMAQIGEFSFIIGTLGLSYGVMSEKIYPIIVAASLVTTFTTPYLIKASTKVANRIESRLPRGIKMMLDSYVTWIQLSSVSNESRKLLFSCITKWALNAVVIITLFTVAAEKLLPLVAGYFKIDIIARSIAWTIAFALSSPSIWAMLSVFRVAQWPNDPKRNLPRGGALLMSRLLTIALVGILSLGFYPAFMTFVITLCIFGVVFFLFRRQIGSYYNWMEVQFESGFQADFEKNRHNASHERLAPWDAHLVEVKVPTRSFLVGKALQELVLREKYGLNVVVIVRDGENIVAPKAAEPLYPGDHLLCFATDVEIERFKEDINVSADREDTAKDLEAYDLKRLRVKESSKIKGLTIRASGFREQFNCIVVGLERGGHRSRSPKSDTVLSVGDVLWVVGEGKRLQELAQAFG